MPDPKMAAMDFAHISLTANTDTTLANALIAIGKTLNKRTKTVGIVNSGTSTIRVEKGTSSANSYQLQPNHSITIKTNATDAQSINFYSITDAGTIEVQLEGE